MRGLILGFNEVNGQGMAATDGGERFAFSRGDWKSSQSPMNGMRIDFSTQDGNAIDVYPVPDTGFNGTGVAVKTPQAQQSLKLGAISLGCGIGGVIIPVIGLVLSIAAFIAGVKAFNLGRHSGEQAGLIMGIIGAIIGALTLLTYAFWFFFLTSATSILMSM